MLRSTKQRNKTTCPADIGPWGHFLHLINQLSIITNAGIIVISSDIDDGDTNNSKLEIFFFIATGMYAVNTFAGHIITAYNQFSLDFQTHKARQDFVYSKHITVVGDEHLAGDSAADGGSGPTSFKQQADEWMQTRQTQRASIMRATGQGSDPRRRYG